MCQQSSHVQHGLPPYLELDLGLSDILGASRAGSDLLCLSDLVANSLDAEGLKWVTLNSVDGEDGSWVDNGESSGKEELLGGSGLLDDLDQSWLELLNGWDVVGEDTHLSGIGGDVDLDDILGGVDLLYSAYVSAIRSILPCSCPSSVHASFGPLVYIQSTPAPSPLFHLLQPSLPAISTFAFKFLHTSCGRDKLNLICSQKLAQCPSV